MILEIISNSVESAISAQDGGADRIELCEGLSEGGITPSSGFINVTRANTEIDMYVMIRPRGGDFLYTDYEFETMRKDIAALKGLGVQGVVLGILKSSGEVDVDRTSELIELAYPLDVTFHRAFDCISSASRGLEGVIETGASRILTSGLAATALEGSAEIKKLIKQAAGRIQIMPGGGIDESNIIQISEETGACEFHSSAKNVVRSKMDFTRDDIYIGQRINGETALTAADENKVRKMKSLLSQIAV